jgi:asparagine synthase (glutamine-hydrolysing)
MSAIFGAVCRVGRFQAYEYERFVRLTDLGRHRGGRQAAYHAWSREGALTDSFGRFDVFLGHHASDGQQLDHLKLDAGRICFDAEIFNRAELISKLRGLTDEVPANDGQILVSLYRTSGSAGFAQINGSWAIAIVDPTRRQVVLSRDRFALKPLYYALTNECLYFASEIKQLLPLVDPRLDSERVTTFLNQGLLDFDDRTLFAGIRSVRPRHSLVFSLDKQGLAHHCYWEYSMRDRTYSFADAVEHFRTLLVDSVRVRLDRERSTGALVSGGLDSSTVATLANRLSNGLATFSAIPPRSERRWGEERFIDAVSESGIRNRKVVVDVDVVQRLLHATIDCNDGPPQGFSAVAHYALMEAISRESDIRILFSGQGADEILFGHLKFYFFLQRQRLANRDIRAALVDVGRSFLRGTMIWQVRPGEALRYLPGWLRPEKRYLRGAWGEEPIARSVDIRQRQIDDIQKYSVPCLTHYEDRNSMAFGIQSRYPYLDHRLVELALTIPPEYNLKKGWTKYLIRSAFPELPPKIRWRSDKQGFILPEARWLRHDLADLIRNLFRSSVLGELGIIDPRAFQDHYEAFRSRRTIAWYTDISRALMAELWVRKLVGERTVGLERTGSTARLARRHRAVAVSR